MGGDFYLLGHQISICGRSPWVVDLPHECLARSLHGFAWLDDLIAVGEPSARDKATIWISEWIQRYGNGAGPGWTAELAGRRLTRWVAFSGLMARSFTPRTQLKFHKALAQHTNFLWAKWRGAPAGISRLEALVGLVHGLFELCGPEARLVAARAGLEEAAADLLGAGATSASRNPEALAETLALFSWAAVLLRQTSVGVGPVHEEAMVKMAQILRGLRHVNGELARFHGGDVGIDGRLEQALRDAPDRRLPRDELNMGFARLMDGRCSVIVDASHPPQGADAYWAHASTLAFEMTYGRQAIVVNCGPGHQFGPDWHKTSRATPSQSTLELAGRSSARFVPAARGEILVDGPRDVPWDMARTLDMRRLEAGHDSWRQSHGLTHARTIDLHIGGETLVGEDILTTLSPNDEIAFDQAIQEAGPGGFAFAIRFHLHPDIEAGFESTGGGVTLKLPGGGRWVMRSEGAEQMMIEPSYYLSSEHPEPLACSQVVLTGKVLSYASRVRWAFSKIATPKAPDDLYRKPTAEGSHD